MNRSKLRSTTALIIAAAVIGLLSTHYASAVVTARWTVDTYKQLDEGEGKGTLITSEGEIKPGWKTERTKLEVDASWAAVRLPDGSVVLGTDDEGAIYKISGGKAKRLASIDSAVAVVSLAVAKDGTLYAGTMPGGEIWTINSKSGKARKLVALPDVETVWAMAIDASGKTLYAGTGPDGKMFRVDRSSGKAKVAFATEDKRVLSLAATSDGAVWLGTSDKAMVFRYDPKKGTARAMADFEGNEVTALAATHAGVIAAANKFKPKTATGARTKEAAEKGTKKEKVAKGEKAKKPKTNEKPGADKETPSGAKLPRKGARKGTGDLYRIEGDGRLEQLHSLTSTYFTSVAVAPTGRIFAGAGDKGRIYMVDTDDSVATAFDVPERQVAQVLAGARGIAFTTADGAAFYRATGAASKAVYTSKVDDTEAVSKFGRIVWHGTGKMKLHTRTGNTAEPGIGWSNWSAPAKPSRAGGESWGGRITSPPGRYIQFRVTFDGDRDSVLRSAAVYHLPQNRPTKVTKIEVGDKDKKIETTKSDAAKPRSPVLKLKWEVDNPDKDKTVYLLAVRREGDVRWRPLVAKAGKPITKEEFEWNAETFPDGHYQLRVTASDHLSNADNRALQSHRTTPLFIVDNNKPTLSGVSVNYPRAAARATDGISAIAQAAYSIDDGPWQLAGSDDGLFDNLSEILTFDLPKDLPAGVHTFAIRAADEAGNIGSASVTFRVR
jgi:sugar lactone lactonase YvrE